jgi:pyruvate dehydrogenase E2 component (dihydrolipoamide acetyltransferase)
MLTEFKLPELGENIETADITKVLVSVGDKIKVDQSVLEIETDKATVEVPSEVEGVVKEVLVKDGDQAKVGDVILKVEGETSDSEEPKEDQAGKAEESTADEKKSDETLETSSKNGDENNQENVTQEESEEEDNKTTGGIIEIELPELGENIESADITKVLVSKGDTIEIDQGLLEIETDKATVEVPSEVAGTIKEVKVKDGDNAKVGDVIFVVETSDGKKAKSKSESKTEKKSEPVKKPDTQKDESQKSEKSVPAEVGRSDTASLRKKLKSSKIAPASPTVRRFAREIGIDIHTVNGTGPGGRISIDDVKVFAKSINEQISKSGGTFSMGVQSESLPDFSKWGEVERRPMSNIRRKTAEHLSYAWSSIPHVTQYDKADITELEKLRKKFAKQAEAAGGKLTITVILLKVIASALKKFPEFNTSVDMSNKEIIYKSYVNIGIAVDTDRGLLVPVIRDVDKKNIIELAAELTELSEKARDKKLSLDEMQGGNFSISNLGGIGGTYFTPIVNSPETAILGVSRGSKEAVLIDNEFVPRLLLPLSLSYDHRVIDGADAARFIRWVSVALENPFLLSLEG